MISKTTMLYLYIETPLHVGAGTGLGSIDLPIQRERTTQFPMIQGSGIKGKLRTIAEDPTVSVPEQVVDVLFGPRDGNDHAGALIIGDARILLFPVRSLHGVFAYVTSSEVLHRFKRDIERERTDSPINWSISPVEKEDKALVTLDSGISVPSGNERVVVLEEFTFTVRESRTTSAIAQWVAQQALPATKEYDHWRQKIERSLIIVPDDDFRDFVLYSTEIITRVKLERDTKTVKDGLWTEEHLPADTLLYTPIYATHSRRAGTILPAEAIISTAQSIVKQRNDYLQLGGDETVGRGMVKIRWGN